MFLLRVLRALSERSERARVRKPSLEETNLSKKDSKKKPASHKGTETRREAKQYNLRNPQENNSRVVTTNLFLLCALCALSERSERARDRRFSLSYSHSTYGETFGDEILTGRVSGLLHDGRPCHSLCGGQIRRLMLASPVLA